MSTSSFMLCLALFLGVVAHVSSFALRQYPAALRVKLSMSTEHHNMQKVDTSATKSKTLSPLNRPEVIGTFFRPSPAIGAGVDERFDSSPSESEMIRNAEKLSAAHISYRRMGISSSLQNAEFGGLEKSELVLAAANADILHLSDGNSRTVTLKSGGLMSDWNFDM